MFSFTHRILLFICMISFAPGIFAADEGKGPGAESKDIEDLGWQMVRNPSGLSKNGWRAKRGLMLRLLEQQSQAGLKKNKNPDVTVVPLLKRACVYDDPEIIETLLYLGVPEQEMFLDVQSVAAVRVFVAAGKRMNIVRSDRSCEGRNRLHYQSGAALLHELCASVDVNKKDLNGATPLHTHLSPMYRKPGYKNNFTTILGKACVLLHHGASLTAVDNKGNTPTDLLRWPNSKTNRRLANKINNLSPDEIAVIAQQAVAEDPRQQQYEHAAEDRIRMLCAYIQPELSRLTLQYVGAITIQLSTDPLIVKRLKGDSSWPGECFPESEMQDLDLITVWTE